MANPKGCWRSCAGASLGLFCIVGLLINAFSIYLPYLQESCGLTNTQSANYISIRSVFAFAALFFVGKYYDKLNIRLGMAAALVLAAGSLWVYGHADSFVSLLPAAALSGLAYGLGGMYPASLLIDRWFRNHKALVLGICSASTGFGSIIGAPIITAAIGKSTLRAVLVGEGILLLICAVVFWLLVRNAPAGAACEKENTAPSRISIHINWMFAAVVAIGALGNTGFQFLSMHFDLRQYGNERVSILVSLTGMGLLASKFLLGEAVDRFGAYRSNWAFFGWNILGCLLIWLGNGYGMAVTGVLLFGLGLAFSTVGLTVYAGDLSTPEEFADTLRQYQIAYLLGALVFGPVPGIIADHTDSYGLFYGLMALMGAFALTVIQVHYQKRKRV